MDPLDNPDREDAADFLAWHFEQNAIYCAGYGTDLTIGRADWERYARLVRWLIADRKTG